MPSTRRVADAVEAELVQKMAAAIGNHVFAGQQPQIIAAVLAELMSILMLNHRIPGDPKRQAELREDILTDWCATVRALVAVETDPPASETMQ